MLKLADIGYALLAALRRPGTLAGAGLVAVGAAFVTNALFLQPRPHPSPFFATRGVTEVVGEKGDALVRAVQEALSRSGRYSGAIDGIAGPQTEAAIESFERAAGRAPTGEPSIDLLAAILSEHAPIQTASVAPAAARPAVAPAESDAIDDTARKQEPTADPLVASIQSALALSAYGPLNADGFVGPETRAAIMRFQRDHSLPVTGEISDGLIVELRAAGAMHDG